MVENTGRGGRGCDNEKHVLRPHTDLRRKAAEGPREKGDAKAMKVTFIGATHEVTGSCSLLEVGNSAFLVDCGMEQGEKPVREYPAAQNPAELSWQR